MDEEIFGSFEIKAPTLATTTRPHEIFLPFYNIWRSEQKLTDFSGANLSSQMRQVVDIFEHVNLKQEAASVTSSLLTSTPGSGSYSQNDQLFFNDGLNCSNADFVLSERSKFSPIIETLNGISYMIIIIGIAFNILNLIVLLKSKLNESPYTYLTMLAFSDLGAISMVGIEKIRQLIEVRDGGALGNGGVGGSSESSPGIVSLTDYSHLYVAAGINIFLSSSMYITLALTIERFIFVHSPFKVT